VIARRERAGRQGRRRKTPKSGFVNGIEAIRAGGGGVGKDGARLRIGWLYDGDVSRGSANARPERRLSIPAFTWRARDKGITGKADAVMLELRQGLYLQKGRPTLGSLGGDDVRKRDSQIRHYSQSRRPTRQ